MASRRTTGHLSGGLETQVPRYAKTCCVRLFPVAVRSTPNCTSPWISGGELVGRGRSAEPGPDGIPGPLIVDALIRLGTTVRFHRPPTKARVAGPRNSRVGLQSLGTLHDCAQTGRLHANFQLGGGQETKQKKKAKRRCFFLAFPLTNLQFNRCKITQCNY
jgi:hypothetical protein